MYFVNLEVFIFNKDSKHSQTAVEGDSKMIVELDIYISPNDALYTHPNFLTHIL
jgi:hypothetical protein